MSKAPKFRPSSINFMHPYSCPMPTPTPPQPQQHRYFSEIGYIHACHNLLFVDSDNLTQWFPLFSTIGFYSTLIHVVHVVSKFVIQDPGSYIDTSAAKIELFVSVLPPNLQIFLMICVWSAIGVFLSSIRINISLGSRTMLVLYLVCQLRPCWRLQYTVHYYHYYSSILPLSLLFSL